MRALEPHAAAVAGDLLAEEVASFARRDVEEHIREAAREVMRRQMKHGPPRIVAQLIGDEVARQAPAAAREAFDECHGRVETAQDERCLDARRE